MSKIMWNDPKFKMKWQEIAVHDDKNVRGFFGDYRFLSNFHACPVEYEGLVYPSSEHAYQAAKVAPHNRGPFIDRTMTAEQSKRAWKGKSIFSPVKWDVEKYDIMANIVFDKFLRNLELREKLLDTQGKYLEETNWWKDTYYGVDCHTGEGKNALGEILMATRSFFLTSRKLSLMGRTTQNK